MRFDAIDAPDVVAVWNPPTPGDRRTEESDADTGENLLGRAGCVT